MWNRDVLLVSKRGLVQDSTEDVLNIFFIFFFLDLVEIFLFFLSLCIVKKSVVIMLSDVVECF